MDTDIDVDVDVDSDTDVGVDVHVDVDLDTDIDADADIDVDFFVWVAALPTPLRSYTPAALSHPPRPDTDIRGAFTKWEEPVGSRRETGPGSPKPLN